MRILYLPNSYSQQRQREKPANIYPVLMAMECEKHSRDGDDVYWVPYPHDGKQHTVYKHLWDKIITEPEGLPFLSLPHPDRVFTRAKEFDSGNYKYRPGTHMMCASGCWWSKCTFCVENQEGLNRQAMGEVHQTGGQRARNGQEPPAPVNYLVRPVDDCIAEIEEIKALGIKEIFDDSGTFPTGRWLDEFCKKRLSSGLASVRLGCNMRITSACDFNILRQAGFRMLLFGIESANQYTLDKINKGIKVEDVIPTLKKSTEAGLENHLAFMVGYPWESYRDAENTIRFAHYLLRKGLAKTAQCSFYTPPKGTGNEAHRKYVNKIYDVWKYPDFWYHKIIDIHSMADLKYLTRCVKEGLCSTIKNI